MTDVVVVATPVTATGFRLGGARAVAALDGEATMAAVDGAIEDGTAAVIAVHASLWSLVPLRVRDAWTTRLAPLILSLPDEDAEIAAAREAGLRDLLARAIGYHITFTPSGGTP
jgi:vacuolar-type H+-ATPase subunit F/Vma7